MAKQTATVTLRGCLSYKYKSYKFKRRYEKLTVTNAADILYFQNNSDFAVKVHEEEEDPPSAPVPAKSAPKKGAAAAKKSKKPARTKA